MSPQKEPALYAAAAAVVALLIVYNVLTPEKGAAWLGLAAVAVPFLQAWWTRRHVIPVETIREAGLDPKAVKRRAEDPQVPRCEK